MIREKKVELITEMKEHLAGNQLFKMNLNDYLWGLIADINKQYDTAQSWEDACRIQGKKKIVVDLIKTLLA